MPPRFCAASTEMGESADKTERLCIDTARDILMQYAKVSNGEQDCIYAGCIRNALLDYIQTEAEEYGKIHRTSELSLRFRIITTEHLGKEDGNEIILLKGSSINDEGKADTFMFLMKIQSKPYSAPILFDFFHFADGTIDRQFRPEKENALTAADADFWKNQAAVNAYLTKANLTQKIQTNRTALYEQNGISSAAFDRARPLRGMVQNICAESLNQNGVAADIFLMKTPQPTIYIISNAHYLFSNAQNDVKTVWAMQYPEPLSSENTVSSKDVTIEQVTDQAEADKIIRESIPLTKDGRTVPGD